MMELKHLHFHDVEVIVRIGKKEVARWNEAITDQEISMYGSIWGECQVLSLGDHYNVYTETEQANWFFPPRLTQPTFFSHTGVSIAPSKKHGGSVSGNFGEVFTIIALEAMNNNNPIRICHLSSQNKCPDLFLESAPLLKYYQLSNVTLPLLPDLIPGECKNTGFIKAVRQLVSFWNDIGRSNDVFGFGIISNIEYKQRKALTITILAPIDKLALELKVCSKPLADITQADLGGYIYGF